MARKYISVDQSEIETLISSMNHLSADLDSSGDSISTSYDIFKKTGLFSAGLDKIKRQFSTLSNVAQGIGRTAYQKADSLFATEAMLANIASEIETPNYLTSVEKVLDGDYNDVEIQKDEGKSINGTNSGSDVVQADEVSVDTTKLKNINEGEAGQEKILDFKDENNMKTLENINNDQDTISKNLKFESNEASQSNLENINNSVGLETINSQFESNVEKPVIKNTNVSLAEYENEEINKWTNCIERLKNVWQGEDAEIFYAKAINYIARLKELSITIDTFGDFMVKAINSYYQEEEAWENGVKQDKQLQYELDL